MTLCTRRECKQVDVTQWRLERLLAETCRDSVDAGMIEHGRLHPGIQIR